MFTEALIIGLLMYWNIGKREPPQFGPPFSVYFNWFSWLYYYDESINHLKYADELQGFEEDVAHVLQKLFLLPEGKNPESP